MGKSNQQGLTDDMAILECKKLIREAQVAIARAWESLDGIEDAEQRSELKYEIIDILRE
jgi:hypothetical protein